MKGHHDGRDAAALGWSSSDDGNDDDDDDNNGDGDYCTRGQSFL